jgi:hypothetical protein
MLPSQRAAAHIRRRQYQNDANAENDLFVAVRLLPLSFP